MNLHLLSMVIHELTFIIDGNSLTYLYCRWYIMSLPLLQMVIDELTFIIDGNSLTYLYYRWYIMSLPLLQMVIHELSFVIFSCLCFQNNTTTSSFKSTLSDSLLSFTVSFSFLRPTEFLAESQNWHSCPGI